MRDEIKLWLTEIEIGFGDADAEEKTRVRVLAESRLDPEWLKGYIEKRGGVLRAVTQWQEAVAVEDDDGSGRVMRALDDLLGPSPVAAIDPHASRMNEIERSQRNLQRQQDTMMSVLAQIASAVHVPASTLNALQDGYVRDRPMPQHPPQHSSDRGSAFGHVEGERLVPRAAPVEDPRVAALRATQPSGGIVGRGTTPEMTNGLLALAGPPATSQIFRAGGDVDDDGLPRPSRLPTVGDTLKRGT